MDLGRQLMNGKLLKIKQKQVNTTKQAIFPSQRTLKHILYLITLRKYYKYPF